MVLTGKETGNGLSWGQRGNDRESGINREMVLQATRELLALMIRLNGIASGGCRQRYVHDDPRHPRRLPHAWGRGNWAGLTCRYSAATK